MASSNKAVLHYFNGKGKAEILRLVMAVAEVEVGIFENLKQFNIRFLILLFQWEQKTITEANQLLALKKGIYFANIQLKFN